jgi:hypothetical protein
MKTTDVTYGQLDRVLRSLGFACRNVNGDPPARWYEHKKTGGFLSLPPFPDDEPVMEHHLVTARVMLDEMGIADPKIFDAQLQRAG